MIKEMYRLVNIIYIFLKSVKVMLDIDNPKNDNSF